jgi:hypothetical protein
MPGVTISRPQLGHLDIEIIVSWQFFGVNVTKDREMSGGPIALSLSRALPSAARPPNIAFSRLV